MAEGGGYNAADAPADAVGEAAEAPYLVDNRQLQARSRGLGYRLSMSLEDRIKGSADVAPWGTMVRGVPFHDGALQWLKVGEKFLPMFSNDIAVLTPFVEEKDSDDGKASGEAQQAPVQVFFVDNSDLCDRSRGLGYRRSAQLENRSKGDAVAPWGSQVAGSIVAKSDLAWVKVGPQQYLPMYKGNFRVLLPIEDIRRKAQSDLIAQASTGDLLFKALDRRQTSTAGLRKRAATVLMRAAEDGRLDSAVTARKSPPLTWRSSQVSLEPPTPLPESRLPTKDTISQVDNEDEPLRRPVAERSAVSAPSPREEEEEQLPATETVPPPTINVVPPSQAAAPAANGAPAAQPPAEDVPSPPPPVPSAAEKEAAMEEVAAGEAQAETKEVEPPAESAPPPALPSRAEKEEAMEAVAAGEAEAEFKEVEPPAESAPPPALPSRAEKEEAMEAVAAGEAEAESKEAERAEMDRAAKEQRMKEERTAEEHRLKEEQEAEEERLRIEKEADEKRLKEEHAAEERRRKREAEAEDKRVHDEEQAEDARLREEKAAEDRRLRQEEEAEETRQKEEKEAQKAREREKDAVAKQQLHQQADPPTATEVAPPAAPEPAEKTEVLDQASETDAQPKAEPPAATEEAPPTAPEAAEKTEATSQVVETETAPKAEPPAATAEDAPPAATEPGEKTGVEQQLVAMETAPKTHPPAVTEEAPLAPAAPEPAEKTEVTTQAVDTEAALKVEEHAKSAPPPPLPCTAEKEAAIEEVAAGEAESETKKEEAMEEVAAGEAEGEMKQVEEPAETAAPPPLPSSADKEEAMEEVAAGEAEAELKQVEEPAETAAPPQLPSKAEKEEAMEAVAAGEAEAETKEVEPPAEGALPPPLPSQAEKEEAIEEVEAGEPEGEVKEGLDQFEAMARQVALEHKAERPASEVDSARRQLRAGFAKVATADPASLNSVLQQRVARKAEEAAPSETAPAPAVPSAADKAEAIAAVAEREADAGSMEAEAQQPVAAAASAAAAGAETDVETDGKAIEKPCSPIVDDEQKLTEPVPSVDAPESQESLAALGIMPLTEDFSMEDQERPTLDRRPSTRRTPGSLDSKMPAPPPDAELGQETARTAAPLDVIDETGPADPAPDTEAPVAAETAAAEASEGLLPAREEAPTVAEASNEPAAAAAEAAAADDEPRIETKQVAAMWHRHISELAPAENDDDAVSSVEAAFPKQGQVPPDEAGGRFVYQPFQKLSSRTSSAGAFRRTNSASGRGAQLPEELERWLSNVFSQLRADPYCSRPSSKRTINLPAISVKGSATLSPTVTAMAGSSRYTDLSSVVTMSALEPSLATPPSPPAPSSDCGRSPSFNTTSAREDLQSRLSLRGKIPACGLKISPCNSATSEQARRAWRARSAVPPLNLKKVKMDYDYDEDDSEMRDLGLGLAGGHAKDVTANIGKAKKKDLPHNLTALNLAALNSTPEKAEEDSGAMEATLDPDATACELPSQQLPEEGGATGSARRSSAAVSRDGQLPDVTQSKPPSRQKLQKGKHGSASAPQLSVESGASSAMRLSPFEKAIMKLPPVGGLKQMQAKTKKLIDLRHMEAMQSMTTGFTVQVHQHCHHHYHVYDNGGKKTLQPVEPAHG
eukprot:TRINITY_DN2963_c0_g1_i3.p1 TRINITY_DN2963_c0_g1~~TRINITY_DN2963_c0_g1_i3.p1  ORF type:complete len:1619 (-),score=566.19 TRINITY_DN2963_c0_g1_i3:100-4956(-)